MIRTFLLWAVLAGTASAQDLRLPAGTSITADVTLPDVTAPVAVGPYDSAPPPTRAVRGTQHTRAYRVPGAGQSAAILLSPLADQLATAGFVPVYTCQTAQCGGFDFRFRLITVPPPDMFVDLGDFAYLATEHPDGRVAWILTSATGTAGYIQLSQISPVGLESTDLEVETVEIASGRITQPLDFAGTLDGEGRVVLEDLSFGSGSATLGDGPFESLQSIADYLAAYPDRQIALVGHTDTAGSLQGNIALSRARAAAVRTRLIRDYGASSGQVDAQGMGYLAPRATNLTEDGRAQNRRVEVILTSTP